MLQVMLAVCRRAVSVVLVCLFMVSAASAGQSADKAAKSAAEVRQELGALMEALQKIRPNSARVASRTAKVQERLNTLTEEQLAPVGESLAGTGFSAAVERLTAASVQAGPIIQASPLPGAEYDSCGSTRSDTDSGRDLTIASDSVNIAAIIGDVACNSIVVILGEGSNLPLCIAAGVLHEAVQAIDFERDLRAYCDGVIDSNEIRGILDNTGVIHSDLATHDADIKARLATHDADIKAALAEHDADIKAILAIVNQKLDAQAVFLVNFRELTMRTQIEADLATADSATPVGLYVTADGSCPTGFCQGYIGQVRTLVAQTIAALAGSATAQATALLAKGDAYLAGGNVKVAYQQYRMAYKAAVGMGGK